MVGLKTYLKNVSKSVVYTTADVLTKKIEYVNDFKSENQEVFKEVYHSIKDYRTTFTRIKKAVEGSKIYSAAKVGYDSTIYAITTGDFYSKQREQEIINKYGGSLMEGFEEFDIDNEDFDMNNEDLSTGDKVLAVAIKKNTKVGTAMTVEAIAETGKAQMATSKENTYMLFTQQERMLSKIDSGFNNITSFLQQNAENNFKIQEKMNENVNKFMSNVDNNVASITKNLEQLLELQRNMYSGNNDQNDNQKKKIGYDDIISRNGVLNIREYAKNVGKNAFNTLNDSLGGGLSMIFGDTMGEGSNMLAQFAATPFRSLMEAGINRALSGRFEQAANDFNKTLEGAIPALISRANAIGKKEDAGFAGMLGKILGIKEGSTESIDTSRYKKGPVPFDGIVKRSITDVIPYYLRKMTSVLTGSQEEVYDYSAGRWVTMSAVKQEHYRTLNSDKLSAEATIRGIIEGGLGRSLRESYANKRDYDNINKAIKSVAAKLQSNYGSLASLTESDLSSDEYEVVKMIRHQLRLKNDDGTDRRFVNVDGKQVRIRETSDITKLATTLRQQRASRNASVKSAAESDTSLLRLIEAEGLAGRDVKDYHGKSYVNAYGDFNQRSIQEMPFSQSLVRAKDEYGVTLYQYLRDMGSSLRFIKANSVNLAALNNGSGSDASSDAMDIARRILTGSAGELNYTNDKNKDYIDKYYENLKRNQERKEVEAFERRIEENRKKAAEKGKVFTLATGTEFKSNNEEVGIARIMAENDLEQEGKLVEQYLKDKREKENKRWDTIKSIFGEDEANKMKTISDKFDPEKSFKENMEQAKDQGFTSNLMMFSKILSSKISNPIDAAADTITKVDYWLQNLIYGEDLSNEEKKKSLFERMKDTFNEAMVKIKDSIDKGFEWIKEKMAPVFDPLKKLGEKIFGTRNEDGIYENGLLSPFLSGVQKGLRKNAQDVADYMKKQAEEAKRKARAAGLLSEEESTEEEGTFTPSTNAVISRARQIELKTERLKNKYEEESATLPIVGELHRKALERVTDKTSPVERFIYGGTTEDRVAGKQRKIDEINKEIGDLTDKIDRQNSEAERMRNQLQDIYNNVTSNPNSSEEDKKNAIKLRDNIAGILSKTLENIKKNEAIVEEKRELLSKVENSVTRNTIKTTANGIVGGKNNGRAFDSVLSAGEYHNGKIVPQTGIYRIEHGDTVINPAPANIRAKQLANEKNYLKSIRNNAEANDRLSTVNPDLLDTVHHGREQRGTISDIHNTIKTNFNKVLQKLDDMGHPVADRNIDESISDKFKDFISDPRRLQDAFEHPLAAAMSAIISVSVPKVTQTINDKVVPWINEKIRRSNDPDEVIRHNAEANDKLTPMTVTQPPVKEKTAEEKAEERRNIQLLTQQDWRSLTDDQQRAEFLGNVASRGILGGGLGLLVGGPLLGAAVGAASSLSHSTNNFSNLIFGDAALDANGDVQVDDKGNVIRKDNGLVSKEIMNAVPDIKKFGLAGTLAGLLTPIGPLGGMLVGAGLGFAKRSEMFQGTLFGDGGIFSPNRMNDLKKALPNIGIGAAAGALFIPGGPFGLLGGALLGATGGYVTATNKFKDAIFGELEDPTNPDSKRVGGVVGAIKDELRPLKDFGLHLRDSILDEIFGKDTGNGREGGIFGAIKDNIVEPIISGGKSVFDELWNKASDLAHLLGDTYHAIKVSVAGNNLFSSLIDGADSLVGKTIHLAGNIGRAATKPFRLLGDEGIGGALKAKRIRTGTETSLTARERLMFRGKRGMAADDNFSQSDNTIASMNREELEFARALLGYNVNQNYFEDRRINEFKTFGQELRKNVNRTDSKKLVKMVKDGRYAEAEKYARTLNISPETKQTVMSLIQNSKDKLTGLDNNLRTIQETGGNVQHILSGMGLNVNTEDKRSMRYLEKQITREIAHTESGLTDEEREWEKQRDFWTNSKSPLNPITTATSNIEKVLERIYYNLSYGQEYDRANDDIRSTYTRDEYIRLKRSKNIEGAMQNMDSKYSPSVTKIGELNGKNTLATSVVAHNLVEDYLPFYTGNLKDAYAPDDVLNRISKDVEAIMDRACQIFDGMVLEQLVKKEAIQSDYNEELHRIANARKISLEEATLEVKSLTRKPLIVSEGDRDYSIASLTYLVTDNKITPYLTPEEQKNYDIVKQTYVTDYVKAHAPANVTTGYMSMQTMIKTAIRASKYLVPTRIPVPLREFLMLHPKEAIRVVGKIVKKATFHLGMMLGSHDLDDASLTQRILNHQYNKEAEQNWQKEVKIYDLAYEIIPRLPDEQQAAEQEKLKFLDGIAKLTPNIQCDVFGLLSAEDREKVHQQFINMYVQAKKDKQIFGRGLLGSTKKVATNVVDRIKAIGKSTLKLGSVLFNASGDAMDAKNRFMKKKKAQAEAVWNNMLAKGKGSKEYDTILLPILSKYYAGQSYEDLRDEDKQKLKHMFIECWSDDAYSRLLYGGKTIAEIIRDELTSDVYSAGNTLIRFVNNVGKKRVEKAKKREAGKLVDRLLAQKPDEYKPKLDALAQKMFEKDYDDLNNAERAMVNIRFHEGYKEEGGRLGEFGRTVVSKFTKAKDKTMGTLKSGITNATAGRIDKIRAWKEKQQEQDTLIGKFFDIMDRRAMKREKEKIEGKKDSRLAKVLKWLFVGGIAVPIIVGFVTDKLLPAIHEKVQPWLQKLGKKVLGIKNEVTGEYEGGIISGIVNPIRKFFKSKFDKIHDWFHNTGEFTSPDTGFKGLIENFKGVFRYGVELWKSGANTIYTTFVPGVVQSIVTNLKPLMIGAAKGIVAGIASWFKKTDDSGKQDLDRLDGSLINNEDNSKQLAGTSVKFNNTVGGTWEVPVSPINVNTNFKSGANVTKNANGTNTITNKETEESVTSEKITDKQMVSAGTNASGTTVYYKRSDIQRTQPYSKVSNGEYIRLDHVDAVMTPELASNQSYQEMLAMNDAQEAGVTDSYTGTTPILSALGNAGKILIKAATSKTNAKGLTMGLKATGGAIRATSGLLSKIPILGVPFRATAVTGKALQNASEGISDTIYKSGQSGLQKAVTKGGAISAVNNAGLALKNTLAKLTTPIKNFFIKLFKIDKIKNMLKLAGKDVTEEGVEKLARETGESLVRAGTNSADDIVKVAGKNATLTACDASGVGVVINLVVAAADFVIGWQEVRQILEIADGEVPVGYRLLTAICNTLQDIPGIGIVFGLIGAKNLINILGPTLLPSLMEDISDKQKEAEETLERYNKENNTNLTLKQYNNIKNATTWSKIKGGVVDAAYFLTGKDATVSESMSGRRIVEDANKTVTKIRKKLESIGSHMWEVYGKKFKSFGLTKTVYGSCCAEVINKIVTILNTYSSSQLSSSLDAASKININFAESAGISLIKGLTLGKVKDPFEKAWNTGYNQGMSYLGYSDLDNTDVSRCIAGIASVFATASNVSKSDVSNIVAEVFGNALSERGEISQNEEKLVSRASAKTSAINASYQNSIDKRNWKISTNANANDKLTPISNNKLIRDIAMNANANDKLNAGLPDINSSSDNVSIFANTIDTAINNMTGGGFENIPEVFNSLARQNADINGRIDRMELSPSDPDFWKIKLDNTYPFASAMYRFMESISRVLKAPFVLASTINAYASAAGLLNMAGVNIDSATIASNGVANNSTGSNITSINPSYPTYTDATDSYVAAQNTVSDTTENESIPEKVINNNASTSTVNATTPKTTTKPTTTNKSTTKTTTTPTTTTKPKITTTGAKVIGKVVGITAKVKEAIDTAKTTAAVTGAVIKTAVTNTAKKIGNGIKNFFGFGTDEEEITGTPEYGLGRGDSDKSDPYHVYQRDFKQSYNTSGDSSYQSVADSGCGPASAVSILRMYGKDSNMNNAVSYALNNKYKEKDGGTYPSYFQDYLGKNGITTDTNASDTDVINSLMNNKPVILMGQNTRNDNSNTPYGHKYSHYVVARGLDRNGNVIVEDSEDKRGSTRYNLSDTLRNTSVRITTGSGRANEEEKPTTTVGSEEAGGLISKLSDYTTKLFKKMYGNFYDATYGSQPANNNNGNDNNNGSIDISKLLGKSLTMSDNSGNTRTMVINQDVVDLYNALTSIGCTPAVACGCIGNWVQECGGGTTEIKKTAIKGKIYYGGGLMQWTPASKHESWARQNGHASDIWSWQSNIDHMKYELENMDSIAQWWRCTGSNPSLSGMGFTECTSKAQFMALTDPEDAAVNYERALEGSGDWNGANSEGIKYSPNMIYCRLRRLPAKILYEIIVNGKGTSGSGRGKKIITSAQATKYGKGFDIHYGRGNDIRPIANIKPVTTTHFGRADEETSTTDTGAKVDAVNLISNLSDYGTKVTKKMYGNFYHAVYGNEQQQQSSDTGNDGSNIVSGVVPYSTYKYWKQGSWAEKGAPWAGKNIACGGYASCESVGCAVVSCAILLAHSGSVNDASFDPGKFIDDMISRGATTSGGAFYTPGKLINYQNAGVMTEAKDYNNVTCEAFGSNSTWYGNSSWDTIYNTLLGELNAGNYVMIKVTIDHKGMHFVALDYIDTSAKEIYIMDPGSNSKWKLSDYGANKVIGYAAFRSTASSAKRYVLNGQRTGAGRGGIDTTKNISGIEKQIIDRPNGKGRGLAPLTPNNNIPYTTSNTNARILTTNNNTSNSRNVGNNYSNPSTPIQNTRRENTNTGTFTSSTFDLNQMIQLISVIAQNSDKMSSVVELLGTIANNTENTVTTISNTNKPQNTNKTPPNGLGAIKSALDSGNSGMDIVNAVYQIAKS